MRCMPPLASLPIDAYNFATLRREGLAYVDKTAYIQSLLAEPVQFAFLARPRRFGKSLLVSTLEHLFTRADDDLFQALDIARSGFLAQVPRLPVIKLDMADVGGRTPREIRDDLRDIVGYASAQLGADVSAVSAPRRALRRLFQHVEQAYGKCVVLVDEYDAPLMGLMTRPTFSERDREETRSDLREFYRTLKTWERVIHFAFITGILDIGGAGLFSALNNLRPLSDRVRYNAICGFTEAEIDRFLQPHIDAAARNFGRSPSALRALLRAHYNGYRFAVRGEAVYNPVSYLTALDKLSTREDAQAVVDTALPRPWVKTGEPYFLFQHIRRRGTALTDVDFSPHGVQDALDLRKPTLNALLFQSGYTTFTRDANGQPILDFPNREVATAFHEGLFFNCFSRQLGENGRERQLIQYMANAFETGDCASAIDAFDRILDGVTYAELSAESHFQLALHVICFAVRSVLRVDAERTTRQGRADIVVETRDAFYAFELKLNKSAAAAIQQITARGYLDRYADAGKRVVGIGLNFIKPRKDEDGDARWEPSQRNYEWDSVPGQGTCLKERERPLSISSQTGRDSPQVLARRRFRAGSA